MVLQRKLTERVYPGNYEAMDFIPPCRIHSLVRDPILRDILSSFRPFPWSPFLRKTSTSCQPNKNNLEQRQQRWESHSPHRQLDRHSEKLDMGKKENVDPKMTLATSLLAKKEHGKRVRENDCMSTMPQTSLRSKDTALY